MCSSISPVSVGSSSSRRSFPSFSGAGQRIGSAAVGSGIAVLLLQNQFDAIVRLVDRCDTQIQSLGYLCGRALLNHHLVKGLPGCLLDFGADPFEDLGCNGLGLLLNDAAQLGCRLGAREAALPLQKGRPADAVLGRPLLPPPEVG